MYNLKLEKVVNNVATYGMDYRTEGKLIGEDMGASLSYSDEYPTWDLLEAAVKVKYPTASVKGSYDDTDRLIITITVH